MPRVATNTMPLGIGINHFNQPSKAFLTHPLDFVRYIRDQDVTDNKTNDLFTFHQKMPVYTLDDIFHREDERLKTFHNWPLDWLDKNQLAQTGMFFTGEGDKVKCYFCEVEIGRWEAEDQPVSEHLRWSPNCPLLRRRTTNNVAIDAAALERLLPAPSYDICGANETMDVRPINYGETLNVMPDILNSNTNGCRNATNNSFLYPDYPEYAIETARLRSFADWPRNMKQKPEQLSEAGFFYTGTGDRVKCFSCGGGLKDWDDNDDPWEQHALWLSKCRYLKLMKGQTYIDNVITKQKAKETDELTNQQQAEKPEVPTEQPTEQPQQPAMKSIAMPAQSPARVKLCVGSNIYCDAAATKSVAAINSEATTSSNSVATATVATATVLPTATTDKKPHSSIPEEKLCKICYGDEYNTAFLPCGHVVACAKCASSVTKCPLCRKPFTDVMRVYFS